MCLGNRAKPSIVYINGQLDALYKNATQCVKANQRAPDLKPLARELVYGCVLRRFYHGEHFSVNPTTDDLAFYALFGRPDIEFICNHEILLHLTLLEGHYYLDPKNVAPRVDFGSKRSLLGQKVAFRVPITQRSSQIESPAIGQVGRYDLSYMVLETEQAEFCDELFKAPSDLTFETRAEDVAALKAYLAEYLKLFKKAGYHVFYTLPDFDDVAGTDLINYSLAVHPAGVDVLGITVEKMTSYLKSRWTEAAYADEKHRKLHYLAEDKGSLGDVQIYTSFRAPVVKPLCKHEVALMFDVREVNFVQAGNETEYANWKIAFLVNTDLEHSKEGEKLRVQVPTASFFAYLSSTSTVLSEQGQLLHGHLVEYLRTSYLEKFHTIHGSLIYDSSFVLPQTGITVPPVSPGSLDTESGCWQPSGCPHSGHNGHVCWDPRISEMVGFEGRLPYDFVHSVTQGALNEHFALFWKHAQSEVESLGTDDSRLQPGHSLARYVFKDEERTFFEASFKAPQIQLVCAEGSRAAIMYVYLEKGTLRTLGAKGGYDAFAPDHEFGEYRVAFRVELELRACSAASRLPDFVRTHFRANNYRNFMQLVLKLPNAKFMHIEPLSTTNIEEAVLCQNGDQRRALLRYLKEHYFPALMLNGHHILHTIPLGFSHDSLSITHLDWRISPIPFGLTEQYRDGLNGRFDRNAIFFLGMTGQRPLPSPTPYPFWICAGFSDAIPSATAVLSREICLDSLIVPLLSDINKDTTIVLSSPRFERGAWIPDVTMWGHPDVYRPGEGCKFKAAEAKKEHVLDSLNFEWSNVEEWKYDRGAAGEARSCWNIACSTRNKLSIPVGTRNGACVMRLEGHVTLKLRADVSGDSIGDWMSGTEGHWSTTITVAGSESGLKVSAPLGGKVIVNYRETTDSGANFSGNPGAFDATQLLQEELKAPDVSQVVTELQAALDGVWPHLFASATDPHASDVKAGALFVRNLVFTKGGHLIAELSQCKIPQVQWKPCDRPLVTRTDFLAKSNGKAEAELEDIIDGVSSYGPPSPTSQYQPSIVSALDYNDVGTRTPRSERLGMSIGNGSVKSPRSEFLGLTGLPRKASGYGQA